jgi:uncharacterized protein YabE (DUF348 family)
MKMNRKLRLQLLTQNGLFVVLLIGFAIAIVWVSKDIKMQWDLTQGQRNTLSQASIDVLKQVTGPVRTPRATPARWCRPFWAVISVPRRISR